MSSDRDVQSERIATAMQEGWKGWLERTLILLWHERQSLTPYSLTYIEDAESHVEQILAAVRQAHLAAGKMREDFPGFPPR